MRPMWAAWVVVLGLSGCVGDNPEYCDSNAQCQDPNREGYDQARKYCHNDGNFCHSGCSSDGDCQTKTDKNKAWHDPARPYCNLSNHYCVAKAQDGGGDVSLDAGDIGAADLEAGGPDRGINGTKCSGDGKTCQSGICVDGYCCDKACTETCKACNLSGKEGACAYVTAGTDPAGECLGDVECGGDMCDGAGQCTTVKTTGTLCKAVCSSSTPTELDESKCDSKGKCLAETKATDCKAYNCVPGSGSALDACGTSCASHGDCVKDGVCDRSGAHSTGGGVCIASSLVTLAKDEATLAAAVASAGAGTATTSHIRLTGSSYSTNLKLTQGTAIVVGGGAKNTALVAKDLLKPVLSVTGDAKLTLQGVSVSGTNMEGIKCDVLSSNTAELNLFECEIKNNLDIGVYASNCDTELRRNRVTGNGKGGVELLKGKFTVVNNLVDGNGVGGPTGANLGGLSISPASGKTVVFSNNTVADNLAKEQKWSGIRCSGMSAKLENSIVWSKYVSDKLATTESCTFQSSNVQGYTGGTNNLNEDPKFTGTAFSLATTSKCINGGPAATAHTKLDILSNPRPKATTNVDMGAYEVM